MGRLDTEGSLHYHVILFLVFLFIFITLKNIDFSDFRDSPLMTDTQVLFVEVLFVVMVFLVTLISFRGYLIKTPEYATRGLFALLIVSLGLFVIFFNLLWDPLINTQDFAIGGLGTVSMAISAILIGAGMVVYITIKFSEDRQQQWFVEAVKDTMHRMEVSEHRPFARRQAAPARRSVRVNPQPKPVYNQSLPSPQETPMLPPGTEPTQQAPSAAPPTGAQVQAPTPVSPKIIKCPQCAVPLKVPDVPQRPLNIRCPHCGAIGTVND